MPRTPRPSRFHPCIGEHLADVAGAGPDVVECDICGATVPDGSVIVEGSLRICERCADDAARDAEMQAEDAAMEDEL